jgi:hypothetical protein
LFFDPEDEHVPAKPQLAFNGIQDVTSKGIELFIITAIRTSKR